MIFRRINRGLLFSCPAPISHLSITVHLHVRSTLVSPQESVLLHFYRHKRPIAIVRPVLMFRVKSMDNSQGKCNRYKVKLRFNAQWSPMAIALSHVVNNQMRPIASNDNSEGKSSRFKGLAIVRVLFHPISRVCHSVYSTLPVPNHQSRPS